MTEYYFDMETTGTNFVTDKIITIQWQRLNGFTGKPIGNLNISKSWESSEESVIKAFLPYLKCRPFDFIFIGKNLLFDFCFLNQKLKEYKLGEIDLPCLYERATVDIKHILVMVNNGNFLGYDKILPKSSPLSNDKIPLLYEERKYSEIVKYIEDESSDFLKAYQIMKKEMPLFKERLN